MQLVTNGINIDKVRNRLRFGLAAIIILHLLLFTNLFGVLYQANVSSPSSIGIISVFIGTLGLIFAPQHNRWTWSLILFIIWQVFVINFPEIRYGAIDVISIGLAISILIFRDSPISRIGVFLLLLQLTVIYEFAALHKLLNPEWLRSATPFSHAVCNANFSRIPALMCDLPPWILYSLGLGGIAIETLAGIGLLIPKLRTVSLLSLIVFHLIIFLIFNVTLYSPTMMVLLWAAL
jgi:hypothetical protein